MGALQPGLPNPAMIPEKWHLLIVDLKDCFFTIALHDNDKQSHQWDEGLGKGNARADRLVTVAVEPPLSPHCRAREAHSIFHQNAKGLARAYKLSLGEARAIVKACPICNYHNSGLG
ncbi:POK18 protein, partial [Glareola pratincola]|nr:POK18 protein [Glareola pratincola]